MSCTQSQGQPSDEMTLRNFSTPIKFVLTTFLIAVGIGYLSALVQIHFQHASTGNAMPSIPDIVARFSGVTWPRPAEGTLPEPKSRFQALIEAPESAKFNGSGSMAAAFFARADDWDRDAEGADMEKQRALHEGERLAVLAWLKDGAKAESYEADSFPKPDGIAAITEDFVDGNAIKIKSIIDARCARCHAVGEEQEKYPLQTHAQILKYSKVAPYSDPAATKQISVEHLATSTHTHLFAFATMFTLTGLIFALSSFPMWVRVILAPLPLLTQVADIACWWMARLDPVGPYFAMAVMGTGGIVGLTLFLQITLSLFNMYGRSGKAMIVVLFLLGGVAVASVKMQVIDPQLERERASLTAPTP